MSQFVPKIANVPPLRSGTYPGFDANDARTYVNELVIEPSNRQKVEEAIVSVVRTGQIEDVTSATVGSDSVQEMEQITVVASRIPAESTPVSKEASQSNTAQKKITITQLPTIGTLNQIIFDVSPRISETQSAEYEAVNLVHHPGQPLKYRTTQPRTWSVSGKLICRNISEASMNLKYVNLIRSWTVGWHGKSDSKYLGAPPPILTLSGYGPSLIGPVKCVLESYSWEFPDDCDYLPADGPEGKVAFPVILSISLSMKESWSPAEFSSFDLAEYKQGNLLDAFSGSGGSAGGGSAPSQSTTNVADGAGSAKTNEPAMASAITQVVKPIQQIIRRGG